MSIWVLLLILSSATGTDTAYQLEKYTTVEECIEESIRVGKGMREAYPTDKGIKIICREHIIIPVEPSPEDDPSNPKKEL